MASSAAAEKTTATKIAPARGKLGVMIVGMGAVATTFVAGVEAIRKGIAKPIGSLTQMGTIRLGKRTDNRSPKINKFVPLANLKDLVFTAWDIFEEDAYAAAMNAGTTTTVEATAAAVKTAATAAMASAASRAGIRGGGQQHRASERGNA